MAISPVSDLVLDVARAADPQKAAATTRALADASGVAPDFGETLNAALPAAAPRVSFYHASGASIRPAQTPEQKAAVGLESVFLKDFVEQMLPKDAPDVFGAGVAGDVWRSMMSEKVANELAQSGRLHIASKLFETHPNLLHGQNRQKIGALSAPQAPAVKLSV